MQVVRDKIFLQEVKNSQFLANACKHADHCKLNTMLNTQLTLCIALAGIL